MAWRGTFVTVPGLLTGFVGTIQQVYAFDAANTLTKITWRVTDAPSGGTVTLRVHDQADGLGNFEDVVIADGTTFSTADVSMVTGAGLWQEVQAESGAAMNLSGEYEMVTGDGITQNFTTLAAVKLDAKIAGTDPDRDSVLNAMISGVTGMMQDWMERDIVQGTVTSEKIDGDGSDSVFTKKFPLLEITTLTEDAAALVENTDFESVGPDLDEGRIVRISGTDAIAWSRGRRNIVTTYDHGYVTVPAALVTAATSLVVAKYFETVQSGKSWRGLSSKGVDPNASVSYDKDIWTRETIPAMKRFRRMGA